VTAKHLDKDFQLDRPHKIETKEHRIIDTFFITRDSTQSTEAVDSRARC